MSIVTEWMHGGDEILNNNLEIKVRYSDFKEPRKKISVYLRSFESWGLRRTLNSEASCQSRAITAVVCGHSYL